MPLTIAKFFGIAVALLVAVAVLFIGWTVLRKSMPFVLAGDIERLAATGPYNSREVATALCGTGADLVGSAKTASPILGLPEARVLSGRPLFPLEGTASIRVRGVGFNRVSDRPTHPCEGTMSFGYRFAWAYNGRAVVLESAFVGKPAIVRR
jgi:hypothetical protein